MRKDPGAAERQQWRCLGPLPLFKTGLQRSLVLRDAVALRHVNPSLFYASAKDFTNARGARKLSGDKIRERRCGTTGRI
jgi:hypothetical protein